MKASVLFGADRENDSVDVLWREPGRLFCILRRHNGEGEKHAFIPVPAAAEHPTLDGVNRLVHEHELKSYLDSTWALRPLELVRERGQTMLVVDYTGGEALDRLVRQPMEIAQFLRLSVALSGAIGQLHERDVT